MELEGECEAYGCTEANEKKNVSQLPVFPERIMQKVPSWLTLRPFKWLKAIY
jgi:hypothetical protein